MALIPLLVACPSPAPTVDLTGIEQRLDALTTQVEALTEKPPANLQPVNDRLDTFADRMGVLVASVDVLDARVTRLDDNVREDLAELNDAATDMAAILQQPLDVSQVDFSQLDLLSITTLSGSVGFLVMTPGECPEDSASGRVRVPATEALSSILYPAPTGLHCLSLEETDLYEAAAVEFLPVEGGVVSVNLFPEWK